MIFTSDITKWLFYQENHSEIMESFGMVIVQGHRQMGLFTKGGRSGFTKSVAGIPILESIKRWHQTGIMHEDVLILEELLLMIRLPLAVPDISILDGCTHKLEIGSGNHRLQLEWTGPTPPLLWQPLGELTQFLRNLRTRAGKPGYYCPPAFEDQ